jgi:hypothetical protein
MNIIFDELAIKFYASFRLAERGLLEQARLERRTVGGLLIFQMFYKFLIQITVLLVGLAKVSQITTAYTNPFKRFSATWLNISLFFCK